MEKKENGLKGFLITLLQHGNRWSACSPIDGERKETMGIHSQSLMLSRRNLMKVLLNSSKGSINCTIVFQWSKPPPTSEKITFAGAFESDFGFTLRERRSTTLDQIQTDALKVEENLVAAGKAP